MASDTIPDCSKEDIVRGLRQLGLGGGDIVLVHSSLKSLGRVTGGPETVIDALLERIGGAGTLLMPTFTGSPDDSPSHPPVFDVLNTKGYTGLITETFRRRAGVIRSLHPTHSVAAIGPAAERYVKDHEFAPTPCGWETPFGRFIRDDGKVLFIGADLESCTLFHSCEEFARVDYHMQPGPVPATVIRGDCTSFQTTLGLHWWNANAVRDYPALEPVLTREGALTFGRAGAATLRLLRARAAVDIAMRLLREDPTALLQRRRKPIR